MRREKRKVGGRREEISQNGRKTGVLILKELHIKENELKKRCICEISEHQE